MPDCGLNQRFELRVKARFPTGEGNPLHADPLEFGEQPLEKFSREISFPSVFPQASATLEVAQIRYVEDKTLHNLVLHGD
jgi:hypothetical protein